MENEETTTTTLAETTSSETTTSTTAEKSDVVYGDANLDGEVSVADAVIMQKYLMCTGQIDAAVHRKAFYHAIDAAKWLKG